MTSEDPDGAEEAVAGLDAVTVRWLAEHAGVRDVREVRPLAGGNSNDTFLVDAASRRVVIRRPPRNPLDPSAHNLQREHRVLDALGPAPAPTPDAIALCLDDEVPSAPFLVMEHVPGVSVTDTLPEGLRAHPHAIADLGLAMMDALADIHSVDWRDAGLEDFGRPDGFLARQVGRWTAQFERNVTRDLPRFYQVAEWLQSNRPDEQLPTVMHGDFHLDNCLVAPDRPDLLAVIDWEMSTIGDPLLDVGLVLSFWGERPLTPCAMPAIQAVSRGTDAPTREMLADRYEQASGRSLENLDYYRSLAFWKLAAIVEGAYAQYVRGRLRSDYARELEQDVPRLLEEAARVASIA